MSSSFTIADKQSLVTILNWAYIPSWMLFLHYGWSAYRTWLIL